MFREKEPVQEQIDAEQPLAAEPDPIALATSHNRRAGAAFEIAIG
jgi:hypothetical protein